VSVTTRILISLFVGLALGIVAGRTGWGGLTAIAEPIGALWLDALRMTIVPLVVSLLITGIARTADSARGGRLAARSVLIFVVILWISATIAALLMPAMLRLWPLPADSAAALSAALGTQHQTVGQAPSVGDFLRSIVPSNPVAAAAGDSMLPLILFVTIFAVAVTRIAAEARERIVGFFAAVEQTMLVIIGWVLWIGPVGVLALAFVVGVNAGTAAIGALAHYVILVSLVGFAVWLLAYPLARFGGGVKLGDFIRAVAPAQAVGLSTQSSLASLPAMLRSSEKLGVPLETAGVPLPIAVAIFRATGPAMNLAVAIYIAHWFGIPLTPGVLGAGLVIAAVTALGSVSLPGQVSFFASIAPIAAAMGVPLEPLALLVAVEMIPDLVRTVGNVTMDVAATITAARGQGDAEAAPAKG
jgi:Na+/H+-dicarboxylate symporter